jgi:hypothetical protein
MRGCSGETGRTAVGGELYDAGAVTGLADQHAAARRDLAHQLRLRLLVLGPDERRRRLRVAALHDGEAAASEAGAAEPRAEDAGCLEEDLVQLDHLLAPAFIVQYGAATRCRDQLAKLTKISTSPRISS